MILTETQKSALIQEIESNYATNWRDLTDKKKDDIRVCLYNYWHPILSKMIAGRDCRAAYGLIRNGKRTYLGYVDGVIVCETVSDKQCAQELELYTSKINTMTKQEIITLLIKDYEEAIEKCKGMNDFSDIMTYLKSNDLNLGICRFAVSKYSTYIYEEKWVTKHGGYWFRTPSGSGDVQEIIQSLQTRLSILKTELEIPE